MQESSYPEVNPALIDTVKEPNWEDLFQFLDEMNLPEDDSERAAQISRWSADDIARNATLIHQKLSPKTDPVPSAERRSVSPFDDSDSIGEKKELIEPENRYALFQAAVNEIHKLSPEAGANPQAFLERAAYLTGTVIVLAHPFEDGNGRTSRVLGHVIKEGFSLSDYENVEDIKLIGKNRPANGYRVNSYVPATEMTEISVNDPVSFLERVAAPEISLSNSEEYHKKLWQNLRTPYT